MADLLKYKLLPPLPGTKILKRPRLLELCIGADQPKTTFLIAPAGYGKTVLLLQLAKAITKPLVWFKLSNYDNDPFVFFQHLTAGIRRHLPSFCLHIPRPGKTAAHLRDVLPAFLNDLDLWTGGGLIVLDDYHHIKNPSLHNFLRELLTCLPSGIQVLIAGRTMPPLPLSRLELQGKTRIITATDLRFTREEISAWWQQDHDELPQETLAMLDEKTAGWPVALRFTGDTPANIANGRSMATAKIFAYLWAEVIKHQPLNIREFMVATSLLEEFTADFCDLLLKRTDSRRILTLLEKQQLFLLPLEDGQAYRYHELLRDCLRHYSGADSQAVLHRAGLLSWEAGNPERAFSYLFAAGTPADLLRVFKEAGRSAFRHGQWLTVARWLEFMTKAQLTADPWVQLYKAIIETYRGRLNEAKHCLKSAETLFADTHDAAGFTASLLVRARLARCHGQYAQSLALLEQAAGRMTEKEQAGCVELSLEKALCFCLTGKFSTANKILATALAQAEENNDPWAMAHLLEAQGNVHASQGHYLAALQSFQKGEEISPAQTLPGYCTWDLICLIYPDWEESPQALEHAKRNAAIQESLGLIATLPGAYLQLGKMYANQSDWPLAEQYFRQAVALIRTHNGDRCHLALSLIYWAEVLSLQGRWIEARAKAKAALAEAEPQAGIVPHICRELSASIFVQTGAIQEGKAYLAAAITAYKQLGFTCGLGRAYTVQAWICCCEGNLPKARAYVKKSLAVAAKFNHRQFFLRRFMLLQPVLKLAMENRIEISFVQQVLVQLGEQALPLLTQLSAHEKSAVRLNTIAPLAEIGGTLSEETMRKLAGDFDIDVRRMAVVALQRLRFTKQGLGIAPSPLTLQILTFGVFRVSPSRTDKAKKAWRTMKTRDLLAYFMHHQEPLSKERILEDLWPDSDQEHAAINFHTTLHYLRRFLDDRGHKEAVLYNGKRYQLRPGCVSTDREQFQELVDVGFRKDAPRDKMVDCLERAVNLYYGNYLDEMEYPWILATRENLKNSCISARMRLVRHYMQVCDYGQAIAHLRAVETLDYFAEEVHALLMKAYAGMGNRVAVDRQYTIVKALLKSELGLAPSREINDLYLKLNK